MSMHIQAYVRFNPRLPVIVQDSHISQASSCIQVLKACIGQHAAMRSGRYISAILATIAELKIPLDEKN